MIRPRRKLVSITICIVAGLSAGCGTKPGTGSTTDSHQSEGASSCETPVFNPSANTTYNLSGYPGVTAIAKPTATTQVLNDLSEQMSMAMGTCFTSTEIAKQNGHSVLIVLFSQSSSEAARIAVKVYLLRTGAFVNVLTSDEGQDGHVG
jgi:hypothetical protein